MGILKEIFNMFSLETNNSNNNNIDLGFHSAHKSERNFPENANPNQTQLPNGAIVQWHVGSLYHPDGSFKSREVLLKFEVGPLGQTDPHTLYRISQEKHPDVVTRMYATEERGSWVEENGSWFAMGTRRMRKHMTIPPEVQPKDLIESFNQLSNMPAFKAVIDQHGDQARQLAVVTGAPNAPDNQPKIQSLTPENP